MTGASRHLALLPDLTGAVAPWPVPFADGIAGLLAQRGRRVVMLVSGDPFWFGAGTSVTRFARLRPHVAPGRRALVLVRDGAAVAGLAGYLVEVGFGASALHVLEALGGPYERVRQATADTLAFNDIAHPVAVGIVFAGAGAVMPQAGLPDDWFDHDGQITKRPVRALTLAALGPRPGERLWDIGAGSGSIAISWLLAHPSVQAIAFEADAVRAARIVANAAALGVDRLDVVEGCAPAVLGDRASPDAIFIGGGLSAALLEAVWPHVEAGARLVVNAVTLESEALVTAWQAAKGGTLMRIELSQAVAIGTKRGWRAQFPIVQWAYPA